MAALGMSPSSARLAVFDLVGTTLRDRGAISRAFMLALAQHGLTVTAAQLESVRGSSKREAIDRLVSEGAAHVSLVRDVYECFCSRVADACSSGALVPIAGLAQLLQNLQSHGIQVALTTGFDRRIARIMASLVPWRNDLVNALVCSDDVPAGRPAPFLIFRAMEMTRVFSVHDVMVVGDTTADLVAGYHASVRWNVGVLSGAHDRPKLEQAPHTHILDSAIDCAGLVLRS